METDQQGNSLIRLMSWVWKRVGSIFCHEQPQRSWPLVVLPGFWMLLGSAVTSVVFITTLRLQKRARRSQQLANQNEPESTAAHALIPRAPDDHHGFEPPCVQGTARPRLLRPAPCADAQLRAYAPRRPPHSLGEGKEEDVKPDTTFVSTQPLREPEATQAQDKPHNMATLPPELNFIVENLANRQELTELKFEVSKIQTALELLQLEQQHLRGELQEDYQQLGEEVEDYATKLQQVQNRFKKLVNYFPSIHV